MDDEKNLAEDATSFVRVRFRATIGVLVDAVEKEPKGPGQRLLRRMEAEGHEVYGHSWEHDHYGNYT